MDGTASRVETPVAKPFVLAGETWPMESQGAVTSVGLKCCGERSIDPNGRNFPNALIPFRVFLVCFIDL